MFDKIRTLYTVYIIFLANGIALLPDTKRTVSFQYCTYNTSLNCKFFTRADPLIFAVNIETNGNPHHHPWSIGKRLLSSWLPVRSAKDQGGSKVTHTL